MKIRIKATGEVIGEVIGEVVTNQNLDIYKACDLAGIDTEEYDVEADLVMDYDGIGSELDIKRNEDHGEIRP